MVTEYAQNRLHDFLVSNTAANFVCQIYKLSEPLKATVFRPEKFCNCKVSYQHINIPKEKKNY